MKKLPLFCILSFVFCTFAYEQLDVSNATFLSEQGIIVKQSSSAKYRLDNTITRAEVVGMALKIQGTTLPEDYTCKNYFTDVKYDEKNNWICRAVELAADAELVSRSNAKFRPQDNISRAEAFSILFQTQSFVSKGDPFYMFIGDEDIADWQRNLITKIYDTGLQLPGTRIKLDTAPAVVSFYPNRSATRAEVFEFARNILAKNTYIKKGGMKINLPDGYEIIQSDEQEYITFGPFSTDNFGPDESQKIEPYHIYMMRFTDKRSATEIIRVVNENDPIIVPVSETIKGFTVVKWEEGGMCEVPMLELVGGEKNIQFSAAGCILDTEAAFAYFKTTIESMSVSE